MEEITLPYDQVDIIISEWMGYFLLYESMLDTVLFARDKYLKPSGIMLPDKASMIISGIEDAEYREEKISFWDDVYGFSMSCIKEEALKEPLVDFVNSDAIVSTSCTFKELDLMTIKKEDLQFTAPFTLKGTQDDYIHAFLSWFDIWFSHCHKKVYFSTGPKSEGTHWKQTVFYVPDTIAISKGDVIEGTVTCGPNGSNPRDLDISISYSMNGKVQSISRTCDYKMC
ncbi:Protein arginine N-methyltransferase 1 [Zancudomyces culisetae]|uniref:Protein arginine N-methyltransferase 1 n=1 Tax=Zancudomyces culisetae TaxID=1213189 RepID=A0A1R1PZD8_ZANCU|nr:Protein arginine N-methyltransferase 1 [Zancudomyces culisetae]|eukprot:OMH86299.1 Protein arginine N-methyltransferase 1 [Zancudomyces culisetae]